MNFGCVALAQTCGKGRWEGAPLAIGREKCCRCHCKGAPDSSGEVNCSVFLWNDCWQLAWEMEVCWAVPSSLCQVGCSLCRWHASPQQWRCKRRRNPMGCPVTWCTLWAWLIPEFPARVLCPPLWLSPVPWQTSPSPSQSQWSTWLIEPLHPWDVSSALQSVCQKKLLAFLMFMRLTLKADWRRCSS